MRLRKKILITAVFMFLVCFGIIQFKMATENTPNTPVITDFVTEAPNETYFCKEGQLRAATTPSNATIRLMDGRSFVLPQTSANTEKRYASDGITFVINGSNSYLQEGSDTTYSDCITGTETLTAENMVIFTSNNELFRFTHPTEFSVSGAGMEPSSAWRVGTENLGKVLAKVVIPKTTQPNTNFSEAIFTIGASSDVKAVEECLAVVPGKILQDDILINGIPYTLFLLGDAGMSNYYDTTSYRTVRDGRCYAIEYTIHTTSLAVYSPEQHIGTFDNVYIRDILQSMARSVEFINP